MYALDRLVLLPVCPRAATLTNAAAQQYGMIRSLLERLGTPIGPDDLMIAAIGMANDLTVITRNTREFGRVVGLRFDQW